MKFFISLLAFFLLTTFSSYSQTGVYKSYDDYVNGNVEKMADHLKYFESDFGVILKFTDLEGKLVKYKPKSIWGFIYKGNLFRTTLNNDIVYLVDTGRVCFYENGTAHLNMLFEQSSTGQFIRGIFCYISSGLDGKIYGLPFKNGPFTIILAGKREYKEFKKKYPDNEDLYDCMDDEESYLKVRNCIKRFNNKK